MKMHRCWFLLLTFIFISCGTKDIFRDDLPVKQKVDYSIIYLINGDGDYLYHDTKGSPHLADEDKLDEAFAVAKHCKKGEVFIFHQKESSGFLFFHSDNGEFYYYRNGNLVNNGTYDRADSPELFKAELKLYNKFKFKEKNRNRYFLYFGHQIPELDGKGYFASYPDKVFNINDFASAVKSFSGDTKFNLLVLSTCHNGTPGIILKLSPFADFIIASPEDLHLSYIDTKYLENLDTLKSTGYEFSKNFAKTAFNQLIKRTQTVVTVVLYDTKKTLEYLDSIKAIYSSVLNSIEQKDNSSIDYLDLNAKSNLFPGNFSAGVTTFYRPPKFGINENKSKHSGWEIMEGK